MDKDFEGIVDMIHSHRDFLETYRASVKERMDKVLDFIQELVKVYAELSRVLPNDDSADEIKIIQKKKVSKIPVVTAGVEKETRG